MSNAATTNGGHMKKGWDAKKGRELTENQNKSKGCICGRHSRNNQNSQKRKWDKKHGEWHK